MAMSERDTSCEERINSHLESRTEDFQRMLKAIDEDGDDHAFTELSEYPLSVEKKTVWTVLISTGGPGDWLEVETDSDSEYLGEITGITYHFNDWFDHAERTLSHGTDEYEAAERFVTALIPS